MAEYIEREALIQRLENSPLFTNFGVDGCFICDGVIDIIKKQPSVKPAADVVEVRNGHWIEADSTRKGEKFVCSVCKGFSYYPQPTRSKNWVKHCGYSYCPHCIAKMDGKDGAE